MGTDAERRIALQKVQQRISSGARGQQRLRYVVLGIEQGVGRRPSLAPWKM